MIPTTDTPPPGLGHHAQFTTTHWSVVLAAGGGDSPAARQALEYLPMISCNLGLPFPLYIIRSRCPPGERPAALRMKAPE